MNIFLREFPSKVESKKTGTDGSGWQQGMQVEERFSVMSFKVARFLN
ncbi:MAG: hypothetical protein KJ630_07860 [Proteobacteria bacterium]|nr:hypothetical protein [Pseudomonadota bacterium]